MILLLTAPLRIFGGLIVIEITSHRFVCSSLHTRLARLLVLSHGPHTILSDETSFGTTERKSISERIRKSNMLALLSSRTYVYTKLDYFRTSCVNNVDC
jgi:hypothetical protein